MKYVIRFNTQLRRDQKNNAQGKAPSDVEHTLVGLGAKVIILQRYNPIIYEGKIPSRLALYLRRCIDYLDKSLKYRRLKADDIVFIQYHYPAEYLPKTIENIKKQGSKVYLIVHDMRSLRFGDMKEQEYAIFKSVDKLFLHTEAMKNIVLGNGVKTETAIMQIFDYYTVDPMQDINYITKLKKQVVFAGNLCKSEFVKELANSKESLGYELKLYGQKANWDIRNVDVEYCGVFSPDNTGFVQGGWGLLWDGASLDTCSGDMGKYLRYNSSHKISLYLSQGIPLILWKESSLAEWATQQNIAITISSLSEIRKAIMSITDDEYRKMLENARCIGEKIRQGHFLKSTL